MCTINFAAGSCYPRNVTSECCHLNLSEKSNFARIVHVLNKMRILCVNFGFVGKPIPTFLVAFHWSYFNISNGFLTNLQNITTKTRFSSRDNFGANWSRSRESVTLSTPNQAKEIDLSNVPERMMCHQRRNHRASASFHDIHATYIFIDIYLYIYL